MANTAPRVPPSFYPVGEDGPEFIEITHLDSHAPEFMRPRRSHDLHNGQWFIDRGREAARSATTRAMLIVCIVAALLGAL